MDKNHLKHLISMLQDTRRSQESLQGGGGERVGVETHGQREREWTVHSGRNRQSGSLPRWELREEPDPPAERRRDRDREGERE